MIIALGSNKGGVGKSTVTCNLAAYFANEGLKVAIVDTDKIGTSGNWIEYRKENPALPKIAFIAAEAGEKLLQTILDLSEVYDVLLIDLQGQDSGNNRLVLTMPHKVIFPFGVSQADLDTLPLVKSMLKSIAVLNKKATFHYLINQAPTTTSREEREAKDWFRGNETEPMDIVIHARKAFRDSMATGYGVTEMDNPKAKDEILALIAEIGLDKLAKKSSKSRGKSLSANL
jgi:chromosome partitioning protein